MSQLQYTSQTASKPITTQKQKATQEISDAVGDAHQVLARVKTVFPFTLFPDTVTLDRAKLTITHRDFFRVGEVISIRIEDILHITADVGPVFGSLQVATRFFDKQRPYRVSFLWRHDTLKLKRITQGYLIAIQKEIDCSALSNKELAELLNGLGKESGVDRV